MTNLPPEDGEPKPPRMRRTAVVRSVISTVLKLTALGVVFSTILALAHPDSPLPDAWNPLTPLNVADPVTPLTKWKLRQALGDPQMCLTALRGGAGATPLNRIEDSENCYIRNRVDLSSVGTSRIGPVQTSCATALRTAMWERHGVQPAAQALFGSEVTVIREIGSYNCRPIRTTQGSATRWSTHATADAIDISGFDLADGTTIRVIRDWESDDRAALFLRNVRDSACTWFATTLGPDYNALHSDHFHLQSRGWGTCR